MARSKAKWRRVLTGRFLRWWIACQVVRLFPRAGVWLGFFPTSVDMIEAADRVLTDDHDLIGPESLVGDKDFLDLCRPHDSADARVDLSKGVAIGCRTALYDDAWIDVSTGSILLPERRETVLVRGKVANWNATSLRMGRERVPVVGRAVALLNTRNYFHVLLENGVRVLDLLESGLVDDAPLTIIKLANLGKVDAALFEGIAALYPSVSVRKMPEGALVVPDQAVCHFPRDMYWEWAPIDRAAVERLTAAFEAVYEPTPAEADERLYLTRRDAKLRDPLNADALEAHLQARGFQPFTATDANHAEQISQFRAAHTVVAVHGAGLTNILFCRPGTRVVEIFPQNFVKSTYWWLARQLDLVYCPVLGGPGDYDQRFTVDINALDAALNKIGDC